MKEKKRFTAETQRAQRKARMVQESGGALPHAPKYNMEGNPPPSFKKLLSFSVAVGNNTKKRF